MGMGRRLISIAIFFAVVTFWWWSSSRPSMKDGQGDRTEVAPTSVFNDRQDSGFYQDPDGVITFSCFGKKWKTLDEISREELIAIFIERSHASLCRSPEDETVFYPTDCMTGIWPKDLDTSDWVCDPENPTERIRKR